MCGKVSNVMREMWTMSRRTSAFVLFIHHSLFALVSVVLKLRLTWVFFCFRLLLVSSFLFLLLSLLFSLHIFSIPIISESWTSTCSSVLVHVFVAKHKKIFKIGHSYLKYDKKLPLRPAKCVRFFFLFLARVSYIQWKKQIHPTTISSFDFFFFFILTRFCLYPYSARAHVYLCEWQQ